MKNIYRLVFTLLFLVVILAINRANKLFTYNNLYSNYTTNNINTNKVTIVGIAYFYISNDSILIVDYKGDLHPCVIFTNAARSVCDVSETINNKNLKSKHEEDKSIILTSSKFYTSTTSD